MRLIIRHIKLIFGLILLLPPVLGVFLFSLSVFGYSNSIINMSELSPNWTGKHYEQYDGGHISFESDWDRVKTDGGGGYTSAAPIYLGLMAISGSILLSSYKVEPYKKD